jgi:hypothetical protein
MPRSVSSIPSMSLHWCAWSSVQDTRGLPKYSPKIGRIWLIRLVTGHSVTVPGRPGCAGGCGTSSAGGVGGAACVADQSAGHDRGVMDNPPSLRINPYRLCETPLVLAVIATASRHGCPFRVPL